MHGMWKTIFHDTCLKITKKTCITLTTQNLLTVTLITKKKYYLDYNGIFFFFHALSQLWKCFKNGWSKYRVKIKTKWQPFFKLSVSNPGSQMVTAIQYVTTDNFCIHQPSMDTLHYKQNQNKHRERSFKNIY